jgi:PhnB protein
MKKEERIPKSNSVQAIPKGFHTVTPYLILNNAAKFLEFVEKAFDGETTFISKTDDNKIMHATVTIGDSTIMVSDSMENMPATPAMLWVYVEEVDEVYDKAIEAKATSVREPLDEFYGDRASAVKDAWTNTWWIATHIEDVPPAELEKRAKQANKDRKEKREPSFSNN